MQGKRLDINKYYKEIRKKAFSEPITDEIIEDFEKNLNNAITSGNLSKLEIKRQKAHLEELKKYNGSVLPSKKKVACITIGSAAALATVIATTAILSHGCSNSKLKNAEYTREETTEDETNTETIDDKKNVNETLENVKSDSIELGKYYIENGFEVKDMKAFAEYLVSYSIVNNLSDISIKDMADILSNGNFSARKGADALQNSSELFKYAIANGNFDFNNVIHCDELATLLNNINEKNEEIKNSSAEKRIEISGKIKSLVDSGITLGNNVTITSSDYYNVYTYALFENSITVAAGGEEIYLTNFINTLPCDNASVIYDVNEETESYVTYTPVAGGSTIDNRAAMGNDVENYLSDSISMAIQYGISDNSEYGYGTTVEEVSNKLQEYINDNKFEATESFDILENRYTNERIAYLESLKPIETIGENDVITTDNSGNTVVVPEEEIKDNGATNLDEYKQNVEDKTNKDLDNQSSLVNNEGETIAVGSSEEVDKIAQQYASDYAKGSADGAQVGYSDGLNGRVSNPNTSGSDGYKAGYRDAYNENYVLGAANRVKEPETKVEFVPANEQEVETKTSEAKELETVAPYVPEITSEEPTTSKKEIIVLDIDGVKYYGYYDENGNFRLSEEISVEESIVDSGNLKTK